MPTRLHAADFIQRSVAQSVSYAGRSYAAAIKQSATDEENIARCNLQYTSSWSRRQRDELRPQVFTCIQPMRRPHAYFPCAVNANRNTPTTTRIEFDVQFLTRTISMSAVFLSHICHCRQKYLDCTGTKFCVDRVRHNRAEPYRTELVSNIFLKNCKPTTSLLQRRKQAFFK